MYDHTFNGYREYIDIIPIDFRHGSCFSIGDINRDGNHNVLDIVTLVNCVLAVDCNTINECGSDMNGDSSYNILDIVTLANCVLSNSCEG